jgi:hypothetical protein
MSQFLNKHCKLQRMDGFCLFGIVREITTTYVLFETPQKTSMIGFNDIRELSLDLKYGEKGYL